MESGSRGARLLKVVIGAGVVALERTEQVAA
jgi:hypothetical protein